jgi:tetratricopeptide (TPR) repeat protein
MQRTHRISACLVGLALFAGACSGSSDDTEGSDVSTTLPEFTDIITAGPELEGSAALLSQALTLAESGRMTEALAGFDQVIAQYGNAADLDTRRDVVEAYFQKAFTQTAMGNESDAVDTYAIMAAAVPDNPDLEITERVSLGMVNRGNLLTRLERYEDAVATFDEMLIRFAERPELEIILNLVGAALGKADALINLNRLEEAVGVYDLVIVETGNHQEPTFERLQVAAFVGKANALLRSGNLTEAADSFNFVLDAWIGNPDGTIATLVGNASQTRADLAAQLNESGVPGRCLFLEEGDCILRDRFPVRPNVESPFLPHVVAFNLEPGSTVYVPYDGVIEPPTTVEGTSEAIVTFTVPGTEERPESRCSVQFVPDGGLQVAGGPATAGAVVGTIADERLSAPAQTGFIYNLTVTCLVRDPAADNRFFPDDAFTNQLFGELPTA